MTKTLKISNDLNLPLDAATQTFGILAKKRRGKTYTASVMAEEMVKASIPFAALDPTGAWWGLRASADGRKAGYPVVIIGGDHGDIPLEPSAGAVIADLIVEHPSFYVIDMSQMNSNAEQDRFAMEFGERLYRAKAKQRFPMHLFVDEADAFIPQQPMPDQRRMLGAYDTIVRRGGIRGIGVTLISQRPAVINKNVLSQVECLIVLQIIGATDRDAIERWVGAHGARKQVDALMDSLASLGLGEAWFWSPAWLDVFKKVQVRKRETFNSSKTPEMGDENVQPKVLAAVDIKAISARVADTIERVKAEDPKQLRKRIAELERELKAKPEPKVVKSGPVKVATIEKPVIGKRAAALLLDASKRLDKTFRQIRSIHETFTDQMEVIERRQDQLIREMEKIQSYKPDSMKVAAAAPVKVGQPVSLTKSGVVPVASKGNGDASLSKCERAILTVLATHGPCYRNRLALLAGYTWSGSFSNSVSSLRTSGFITGGNSEVIQITAAGGAALGQFDPLPQGDELRRYWLSRFGSCERKILTALFENPKGLEKDDLCRLTGYAFSGSFSNSLSRLRTAGVLVGANNQTMTVAEDLLNG